MPLAQPLAELRQQLEAQIRENQLPDALNTLLLKLPDGSETYRIVSALIARLNAANKERYRNTITFDEYQRRIDQVSADFFDLLGGLTEEDFLPAVALAKEAKVSKVGSVLYRVPHVMPIQKPTRCTIRVAVDEDAILENILLDEHVEVKNRVEISDVMSAELLDPEGGTFQITPLNTRTQLVRDTGYTEWNFSVTPLVEGVHQLLVKVSIMEIVPGFPEPIPREVSVMETVTIVTENSPALPAEATAKAGGAPSDFKPSGQTFAFQSTATSYGYQEVAYHAPSAEPQALPRSSNRGLRALALFLAFLVIVPAATWAVAPDFPPFLFAQIEGTAEAFTKFIEKHPNSPRLEKAYRLRAESSDLLADWRAYQDKYGESGKYAQLAANWVDGLATKSIQSIRENPDPVKIRQFVQDFPESERLTEVKQAVETRQENRQELLAEVENAYVASVQAKPTKSKVVAYLRDFPKQERLNEVAAAVAANHEVSTKSRPALDEAITRKVEAASTAAQVRNVLPALESAGSSEAAAKVEKLLEQKPHIRKQVQQQVRQSVERVKLREESVGVTSNHPDTTPMSEAERFDWETATLANTARAFVDFVNKYPKTTKLPEARAKINALKPSLSPEEQAWADATLANSPEAYIYFVQKHPGTARAVEARAHIKTFSLSIKERKRLESLAAQRLRDEQAAIRQREEAEAAERQREKSGGDFKSLPDSPERPRRSGLEMVSVAGGRYTMGSPESEEGRYDYQCPHQVSIGAFSIGKYEVTQGDWFEIMGTRPSYFKDCDECPVEEVSWNDIQGFLKKLNTKYPGKNYRLPTEAEWEYAARGGKRSKGYTYAGSNYLKKVGWCSDNLGSKTHRVGELAPNELGIFDMSGNVYEWCQDTWGPYSCDKEAKAEKSLRVVRGGCWNCYPFKCRAAHRDRTDADARYEAIGFRLAR